MKDFLKEDVLSYFLNFDITNYYEMGSAMLFFCLDYFLSYNILKNIRKILRWYYRNDGVSPGKLLCINSILLLSVIIRMICNIYGLLSCYMSDFYKFDKTSQQTLPYIYFNIDVYQVLQSLYIAFENLAQVVAANFWVQAINSRVITEGDSNSQSLRQPTSCAMNTFAFLVRFSSLIVLASLITSFILMDVKSDSLMYFVLFSGIISSLFFCISCYLLVRDLTTVYKVNKDYNYKVKLIGITLILTQMVRFIINILYLKFADEIIKFKMGQNDPIFLIPDKTFSWAIFIFFYSLIVDFYPTWRLSFLFSPFDKKKQKTFNSSTSQTQSRSFVIDSASPQGSQEWGDI